MKLRALLNPKQWIKVLIQKNIIKVDDETFLKAMYKEKYHKDLNLENPITFNEKLQWLKLYDRKEIYTTMVDKYEAKKYVADIIGEEYIIPTIAIYDNFDEINFDKLPNQFVIKCTHDCGGVVIVKDKTKLNIKDTKKKINKHLKRNYYYMGREWPYKNVKPRIIIEKYMCPNNKNFIEDYKFQTFNGKVAYSFVCTDRNDNVKYTFFDRNKIFIDVTQCGAPNDPKKAQLPQNYNKMVKLAEMLSKDTLALRVDFYEIEGRIYFGELTFFDSSGFGKFEPEEWDKKFGDMLDISKVNKNEK